MADLIREVAEKFLSLLTLFIIPPSRVLFMFWHFHLMANTLHQLVRMVPYKQMKNIMICVYIQLVVTLMQENHVE